MGSSLLVAQMNSLGEAYRLVNQVSADLELEVLELSPLGGQAIVLIKGALNKIQMLHTQVGVNESSVHNGYVDHLLKCYLSQENTFCESDLVIIEDSSLGNLFRAGEMALDQKLKIFDFRFPRFDGAQGFLVLTTSDTTMAGRFVLQLGGHFEKVQHITGVQPAFKKFIGLVPN